MLSGDHFLQVLPNTITGVLRLSPVLAEAQEAVDPVCGAGVPPSVQPRREWGGRGCRGQPLGLSRIKPVSSGFSWVTLCHLSDALKQMGFAFLAPTHEPKKVKSCLRTVHPKTPGV